MKSKNLLRISTVVVSIGLILTAGGCPEDSTTSKGSKQYIALTEDGTFTTSVLKVNAHGTKIRVLEPHENCKWALYYSSDGTSKGTRVLVQSGGWKNTTVNLNKYKVTYNKKTKKSYRMQANIFVTKGCRTWVKK